jgi:two-component system, chemotaxis family, response regulator Rcp1
MVDITQSRLRVRCFASISWGAQVRVRVARALVFGKVRHCRPLHPSGFEIEIKTLRVVMQPHKVTSRPTNVRPIWPVPMEKSSPNKPLNVLLVEDNPGDVTLTRLVLDATGVAYRLEVARDGAEAVYRLCGPGRPKPALLLLDMNLPKMNGIEVLERIRTEQVCPSMTVALFSTCLADSDLRRADQLGVQAYFEKPRNFKEYEQLSRQVLTFLSDLSH